MSNSLTINVPNPVKQNTPLRNVPSGSTDYSVKYVPQTLTEQQKAQARENIGVEAGGEQVQSDWNQTDTSAPDYIKNKPDISEDIILHKNGVVSIYCPETMEMKVPLFVSKTWVNGILREDLTVAETYFNARGFVDYYSSGNRFYHLLKCPPINTEVTAVANECDINTVLNDISTNSGKVNIVCYNSNATCDDVGISQGWLDKLIFYDMTNTGSDWWSSAQHGCYSIVFNDCTFKNLQSKTQEGEPTTLVEYRKFYVPKNRYSEFSTKIESLYGSTWAAKMLEVTTQYDFLTIGPNYNISIVILPTLPLTMTDANNNTISGDFVAQNVTITPAV